MLRSWLEPRLHLWLARPWSMLGPILVVPALAAAGCTLPDDAATEALACPDRPSFAAVSPFLEAGCGTLDCHGATPRPLRIRGFGGLRLDPADNAGGTPTTSAEVDANYTSVCGLTPEAMADVVHGAAAPDTLLLVTKARAAERHKGGAIVKAGDDGDRCMTSWLAGMVDAAACARAAKGQGSGM
ncbi:MAG: hypothetical protein QM820_03420 [Minicystis sp.]